MTKKPSKSDGKDIELGSVLKLNLRETISQWREIFFRYGMCGMRSPYSVVVIGIRGPLGQYEARSSAWCAFSCNTTCTVCIVAVYVAVM